MKTPKSASSFKAALVTSLAALLAALLVAPAVAVAGPSTSGGGYAVVCRDANNAIHHSELLDLYESKVTFGFELLPIQGTLEQDYKQGVKNTYWLQGRDESPLSDAEIAEHMAKFMRIVRFTDKGKRLPDTEDLGEHASPPEGCAIEQLAVFEDLREVVHVDSEIWASLETRSRAALISHELFFREYRRNGDRTSAPARAVVAHIFARGPTRTNDGLPAVHRGLSATHQSREGTRLTTMETFADGNHTVFQFSQINNRPNVAKAVARIPHLISWNVKAQIVDREVIFVVDEPDTHIVARAPVESTLVENTEVELVYITGRPVKLNVYEQGRLVAEQNVYVWSLREPTQPGDPSEGVTYPPPVRTAKMKFELNLVESYHRGGTIREDRKLVCRGDALDIEVHELKRGQNAIPKTVADCRALLDGRSQSIQIIAGLANLDIDIESESRRIFKTFVKIENEFINADAVTRDTSSKRGSVSVTIPRPSYRAADGTLVGVRLEYTAEYLD